MKKMLCLCLAALMCFSFAAADKYVPRSASKLPARLSSPECPEILRVQKTGDAIVLTFADELPEDAFVLAFGRDTDYTRYIDFDVPGDGISCTADGLPQGGWWTGFDICWHTGDVRADAHYNAAGGLESVTRYDSDLNAYTFDSNGRLWEYANAEDSVRVRFDSRGVMTSYGHQAYRSMFVWFTAAGNVVRAEYDEGDGGMAASWEPEYGWYVDTADGRQKLSLDLPSPWDAKRLIRTEEAPEKAEVIHYPNNTICVAGLTLQEADPSLPDKWYNVLPIDLTREGRQQYQLMISNMFLIGDVYVDVWDGEVTVSVSLLESGGVKPLSWYGRWFTSLSDITSASIESTGDGLIFGEAMSIVEELDGAETALLFIRSKASYYQPFRDGTALTRYWRNKAEWKEFRQELQELMPRMAK